MGSNSQRTRAVGEQTDRGSGPPEVTIELQADGEVQADRSELRDEVLRLREQLDQRETELELVVERYERQLERRTPPPEEREGDLRVESPGGSTGRVRTAVKSVFARFG